MSKRAPKLPRKLSELLRIAVSDAKSLARRKGFALDMSTWVRIFSAGADAPCHVCMAGAVIVNRLDVAIDVDALDDLHPSRFPLEYDQLSAIDHMRAGSFGYAYFELFGICAPPATLDLLWRCNELVETSFSFGRDHGRAPWRIYMKAATMLEEAGL